jgi:hypothetical protein
MLKIPLLHIKHFLTWKVYIVATCAIFSKKQENSIYLKYIEFDFDQIKR